MRFASYDPGAAGIAAAVVVRAATPDDAVVIAALDGERNGVDPATIVDKVRAHLAAARDPVLVAEVDGDAVGFGRLGWVEPGPAHRNAPRGWYLVGVIVRPDQRRRGVGHALVRARLALAAALGAAEVFSATSAQNLTSLALHERFGFTELTRDFELPGVAFPGGVLLRVALDEASPGSRVG